MCTSFVLAFKKSYCYFVSFDYPLRDNKNIRVEVTELRMVWEKLREGKKNMVKNHYIKNFQINTKSKQRLHKGGIQNTNHRRITKSKIYICAQIKYIKKYIKRHLWRTLVYIHSQGRLCRKKIDRMPTTQ